MFVIEDYIKVLKDGRFVRIPNMWFTTAVAAHTEPQRLKESKKISKYAVVTLYKEEGDESEDAGGDR